jgi:adenylate cyclase
MMKSLIVALFLSIAAVYLFVTAPPPLKDEVSFGASEAPKIPVKALLDAANLVNAAARKIYTERIVTRGQEAGLAFNEDWQRPEVEAGPLPALFLREVAAELRKQDASLALFLGSDQPISPSNAFKGEQVGHFDALKQDQKPRYFEMPSLQVQVALYADLAVVPGCVSCHNEHPNTPKRDWKLGDVMGATTWTYPRPVVSDRELRQGIAQVYEAVGRAYATYLDKTRQFREPTSIDSRWPEKGRRQLPDVETFISAVKDATAPSILDMAVLLQ